MSPLVVGNKTPSSSHPLDFHLKRSDRNKLFCGSYTLLKPNGLEWICSKCKSTVFSIFSVCGICGFGLRPDIFFNYITWCNDSSNQKVYLFISIFISIFIQLFISIFIYLLFYIHYLCIYLFMHQFIHLFIYLLIIYLFLFVIIGSLHCRTTPPPKFQTCIKYF